MYHYLYVGVTSLGVADALWRELMGLQPFALDPGYARSLERLWGLEPHAISEILGLETPGAPGGRLVFVEFSLPSYAVRDGAKIIDLCPKNLDVNVVDLPQRAAELQVAGYVLRSEPVAYSIGQLAVREVQLAVHDDINLVLAEIVGEPLCATRQGYGGVTSTVTVVGEIAPEQAMLEMVGFEVLDAHQLSGSQIEQMVGLPRGGELQMQLLGNPSHRFGRAELVSYVGALGASMYPRTKPPARGLIRGGIRIDDIESVWVYCTAAGYACSPVVTERDPSGKLCSAFSIASPAGWVIDVWEKWN